VFEADFLDCSYGFRPGRSWRLTLETMAICCAAAERMVEARRYFDAIQQQSAYPSDLLGPIRLNNPRWRDEMENWLQKASGAR
jgi:hypothetical protein